MKRQESTISSNKKRGLKYALCIITLLCCLLSTIVQATDQRDYNASSINRVGLFHYETYEATGLTYVSGISGTIINNGEGYDTNYRTTYTAVAMRLFIEFDTVSAKQIDITITSHAEFDGGIEYNPNLTEYKDYGVGTGSNTINVYRPLWRYTENSGTVRNTNLTSNQVSNNSINISANNSTGLLTIKAYRTSKNEIRIQQKFNEVTEIKAIMVSMPYTWISSKMVIDKFSLSINNEEYQIIEKWNDKQRELEEALQDIEVTVDQNAIEDIINNPPTIDSAINVGIFNFTNETIPLYIMSLTLSLAIISFLLYGKK